MAEHFGTFVYVVDLDEPEFRLRTHTLELEGDGSIPAEEFKSIVGSKLKIGVYQLAGDETSATYLGETLPED